jgi:transcriptional regulator GlxA family with amidase domain
MEFVHDRVVWDDRIVTAGGVTSGIELALEIIEQLCGADVRKACEAELEITTPG